VTESTPRAFERQQQSKTIKAVLFDFDDTLIDVTASREERARRAYRRLRAEGVNVSWGAFWRSINDLDEGGFYRRGMEAAVRDLGLHGTALGDECTGFWVFRGAEELLALSTGCTDLLDVLHERYRLGVITNGPSATQRHKFEHTGLQDYFELFLPSGEVGVHKPEPEIFRIALERMQLEPSEAVFVGDHLDLDIIGAQRAGMRGVLYNPGNRRMRDPYITPDAVIRSLDELPGVLEALA
jgi:putative hydrolase of the HAD superfamily